MSKFSGGIRTSPFRITAYAPFDSSYCNGRNKARQPTTLPRLAASRDTSGAIRPPFDGLPSASRRIRPLRQQPLCEIESLLRLGQLLVQPVHVALQLLDARRELIGRPRGQTRAVILTIVRATIAVTEMTATAIRARS